jgi:hypothetical protein
VFYIDVAKVDWDVVHVAMVFSSVCPTCFVCFRHLLQVLHLGVAKVDLDVAYTYMLQAYVSGVSYVCCKCFIWTLHMFRNGTCFSCVSYICCKCFNCFEHMLQVFQLFQTYGPVRTLDVPLDFGRKRRLEEWCYEL